MTEHVHRLITRAQQTMQTDSKTKTLFSSLYLEVLFVLWRKKNLEGRKISTEYKQTERVVQKRE